MICNSIPEAKGFDVGSESWVAKNRDSNLTHNFTGCNTVLFLIFVLFLLFSLFEIMIQSFHRHYICIWILPQYLKGPWEGRIMPQQNVDEAVDEVGEDTIEGLR